MILNQNWAVISLSLKPGKMTGWKSIVITIGKRLGNKKLNIASNYLHFFSFHAFLPVYLIGYTANLIINGMF
jgi:hypothetical protein